MLAQRFAVLLALVLSAGWANAQARDPAAADALFREARSLMQDGKYAEACPKFAESQRLDPAAGTGINLGDCYQKTGKLADALQSLRDALDMLAPDDPRRDPVKHEIAALEKRVPRLTIKLDPKAPEGTTVTKEGVEYGAASLGVPLPVNPGEQWVVVASPGRAKKPHRVALVEGQTAELTVGVGPALPSGATADASPSLSPTPYNSETAPNPAGKDRSAQPGPKSRTASYVVAGIGALGLIIATPTYFYLRGKEKDAQAGDAAASDDGKRLLPVFYGALAVGVVGLGLGGYLYFSADTPEQSATAVSVGASPFGAGVSVRSQF